MNKTQMILWILQTQDLYAFLKKRKDTVWNFLFCDSDRLWLTKGNKTNRKTNKQATLRRKSWSRCYSTERKFPMDAGVKMPCAKSWVLKRGARVLGKGAKGETTAKGQMLDVVFFVFLFFFWMHPSTTITKKANCRSKLSNKSRTLCWI